MSTLFAIAALVNGKSLHAFICRSLRRVSSLNKVRKPLQNAGTVGLSIIKARPLRLLEYHHTLLLILHSPQQVLQPQLFPVVLAILTDRQQSRRVLAIPNSVRRIKPNISAWLAEWCDSFANFCFVTARRCVFKRRAPAITSFHSG